MEFEPAKPKITDIKTGLAKAEHFCAYQERSQQDVRNKLYGWGLWPDAVEQIIAELIGANFISEERFAKAYVQGKFNQNGWGRLKIKQGLKFKRIPDGLIKKALAGIDTDKYLQTLAKTIEKKAGTLSEKHGFARRYRLQQFAAGRGFEGDLIADVLKGLGLW